MPCTAVSGQGMWCAWTRVFERPEDAFLDLLDKCFDATLHEGFHGKIAIKKLQVQEGELPTSGITIMNNSQKPIKSLEDALTVYKSSKNASLYRGTTVGLKKDDIGENGVGLKHGCATLSDDSFIVARNDKKIEIGLIAKKLQTQSGVYLPHFSFDVCNCSASETRRKSSVCSGVEGDAWWLR